jgi:UDPglucose 6-dehydrogenase
MVNMAVKAGLTNTIFEAVESRNQQQQLLLVDKIMWVFGDDLTGKKFALWGLAFKPDTDDIRCAPAIEIAQALTAKGGRVAAYDPQAMITAAAALKGCSVDFVEDPYEATEGADALVVVTEWRQFRQPDFRRLAKQLKSATIFDGRNIYNPDRCNDYGLAYIGIGRSSSLFHE